MTWNGKRWGITLSLATLLFAGQGKAYVPEATQDGKPVRWADMPVRYEINRSGTIDIAGDREFESIRDGVQSWTESPGSAVSAQEARSTSVHAEAFDGRNTVEFVADHPWLSDEVISLTVLEYSEDGSLLEADVLLNDSAYRFTAGKATEIETKIKNNGRLVVQGEVNLPAVMAGEAGHMLGLSYSGLPNEFSRMNPFAANGDQTPALEPDDVAALTALYPAEEAPLSYGSVEGRVFDRNDESESVFGALVSIHNQDGAPVVSALTGKDGRFEMQGVPESTEYTLEVEPAVQAAAAPSFYQSAEPVFAPASVEASKLQVEAGKTTAGVNRPVLMQQLGSDPYEPNDTVFDFVELSNIETVSALIDQAGDVDIYRVRLRRGSTIRVEVEANRIMSNPQLIPQIRILSAEGEVKAVNSNFPGLQGDARIDFWAREAGGFFFIEISNINSAGGLDFVYNLMVEQLRQVEPVLPESDLVSVLSFEMTTQTLINAGLSGIQPGQQLRLKRLEVVLRDIGPPEGDFDLTDLMPILDEQGNAINDISSGISVFNDAGNINGEFDFRANRPDNSDQRIPLETNNPNVDPIQISNQRGNIKILMNFRDYTGAVLRYNADGKPDFHVAIKTSKAFQLGDNFQVSIPPNGIGLAINPGQTTGYIQAFPNEIPAVQKIIEGDLIKLTSVTEVDERVDRNSQPLAVIGIDARGDESEEYYLSELKFWVIGYSAHNYVPFLIDWIVPAAGHVDLATGTYGDFDLNDLKTVAYDPENAFEGGGIALYRDEAQLVAGGEVEGDGSFEPGIDPVVPFLAPIVREIPLYELTDEERSERPLILTPQNEPLTFPVPPEYLEPLKPALLGKNIFAKQKLETIDLDFAEDLHVRAFEIVIPLQESSLAKIPSTNEEARRTLGPDFFVAIQTSPVIRALDRFEVIIPDQGVKIKNNFGSGSPSTVERYSLAYLDPTCEDTPFYAVTARPSPFVEVTDLTRLDQESLFLPLDDEGAGPRAVMGFNMADWGMSTHVIPQAQWIDDPGLFFNQGYIWDSLDMDFLSIQNFDETDFREVDAQASADLSDGKVLFSHGVALYVDDDTPIGDFIDNDGDGLIDEELRNGRDDDLDGVIDEPDWGDEDPASISGIFDELDMNDHWPNDNLTRDRLVEDMANAQFVSAPQFPSTANVPDEDAIQATIELRSQRAEQPPPPRNPSAYFADPWTVSAGLVFFRTGFSPVWHNPGVRISHYQQPVTTNDAPVLFVNGSYGQPAAAFPGQDIGLDFNLSTYLGGVNGTSDIARDVAVDATNDVIVVGETNSTDFPTTTGALSTTLGGSPPDFSTDAFVMKFDSGGNLLWSTYLGGVNTDAAYGVAVDSNLDIYVVGYTDSNDFPQANQGSSPSNRNVFVSKFSPGGTLLDTVILGGNQLDEGYAITAVGPPQNINVYLTGRTSSTTFFGTRNFAPAFQQNNGGLSDGFIARLNSSLSLTWSGFIGGSGTDEGRDIAADLGRVYVTGLASADFPTQPQAAQRPLGSNSFVMVFSTDAVLEWSNYLGGDMNDEGWGIDVSTTGDVYVTGQTSSSDFPTPDTTLTQSLLIPKGGQDIYLAKYNPVGTHQWSAFLGGGLNDIGYDVEVSDFPGSTTATILLTGEVSSQDFFACGLPLNKDNPSRDVFISSFDPQGVELWSTLVLAENYPAENDDVAYGIALDSGGNAYVTGRTESEDYLTSNLAFDRILGSGLDGFLTRVIGTANVCPEGEAAEEVVTYAYSFPVPDEDGGNGYDFTEGDDAFLVLRASETAEKGDRFRVRVPVESLEFSLYQSPNTFLNQDTQGTQGSFAFNYPVNAMISEVISFGIPNDAPTVEIMNPALGRRNYFDEDFAYTIQYEVNDTDSSTILVNIYLDNNQTGFNGVKLNSQPLTFNQSRYEFSLNDPEVFAKIRDWFGIVDVRRLTEQDHFYVYIEADDQLNEPVFVYSEGYIQVDPDTVEDLVSYIKLDSEGTIYGIGTNQQFRNLPTTDQVPARDIEILPGEEGLLGLLADGRVYGKTYPGTTLGLFEPYRWYSFNPSLNDRVVFSFDSHVPGADFFIDVEADPKAPAYYLLTRNGDVSGFGNFYSPIVGSSGLSGVDAVDMELLPDGKGLFVLDSFGGIHSHGDVSSIAQQMYFGWDVAVDMELSPSGKGFNILTKYGHVSSEGDSPGGITVPGSSMNREFRNLALTPDNEGYLVLDASGEVTPVLTAQIGSDLFQNPEERNFIDIETVGLTTANAEDLIREYFDAYQAEDIDRIVSLLTDDYLDDHGNDVSRLQETLKTIFNYYLVGLATENSFIIEDMVVQAGEDGRARIQVDVVFGHRFPQTQTMAAGDELSIQVPFDQTIQIYEVADGRNNQLRIFDIDNPSGIFDPDQARRDRVVFEKVFRRRVVEGPYKAFLGYEGPNSNSLYAFDLEDRNPENSQVEPADVRISHYVADNVFSTTSVPFEFTLKDMGKGTGYRIEKADVLAPLPLFVDEERNVGFSFRRGGPIFDFQIEAEDGNSNVGIADFRFAEDNNIETSNGVQSIVNLTDTLGITSLEEFQPDDFEDIPFSAFDNSFTAATENIYLVVTKDYKRYGLIEIVSFATIAPPDDDDQDDAEAGDIVILDWRFEDGFVIENEGGTKPAAD